MGAIVFTPEAIEEIVSLLDEFEGQPGLELQDTIGWMRRDLAFYQECENMI